jgi:ADP-heptose:LPS heptosyltransferase
MGQSRPTHSVPVPTIVRFARDNFRWAAVLAPKKYLYTNCNKGLLRSIFHKRLRECVSVTSIKVDTMRRIDRWVGVPLCMLATALLKIWWWLRPMPPRSVRRILFIELSEMGSTILADPAMRKARARLNAELYFAIFTQNAGSLDLTGTISSANVFQIRSTSLWHIALDTLAFLSWTHCNGIDTVVDLELFSRFTGLLTGLSGANRRVGFYRFHNEGLYRGEMLTHRVSYNPHIHIAKNFIALIDALLSSTPTVPYSKTLIDDVELTIVVPPPSESAREAMLARVKLLIPNFDPERFRVVLINPNASELLPQRRWMPERFIELIRRILAANPDALVLITGAPNEQREAEDLVSQCASDRCVSFAGYTTVANLPALYSLGDVMVTNDSGPAHISAAIDLPTIVLFGPETPNLYRPLGNSKAIYAGLACSPCVSASNHRKSACNDNACMRAISVERVFAAVTDVLVAPTSERV